MSVILIWTKTKKVGSHLIRWGLNEPVSHFAIIRQFDDPSQGVVIHQAFHGFDISWYPTWLKENEIVHALTPKVPLA